MEVTYGHQVTTDDDLYVQAAHDTMSGIAIAGRFVAFLPILDLRHWAHSTCSAGGVLVDFFPFRKEVATEGKP